MAQIRVKMHDIERRADSQLVDEAHKLLKKCADKWAEGNPETPPVEEVLRKILDIFAEAGHLRRSCRAVVDPVWLSWNGGTITKLAQAINNERAFDRLPILADALEDAGCTDAGLLAHCRGPGLHVMGCWVVDILLGNGTSSVPLLPQPRGGKALPSGVCESDPGPRYERAVEESYSLLKSSAEVWAEGNPEDPPTRRVLREILAILVSGHLLRLLGNPHADL